MIVMGMKQIAILSDIFDSSSGLDFSGLSSDLDSDCFDGKVEFTHLPSAIFVVLSRAQI